MVTQLMEKTGQVDQRNPGGTQAENTIRIEAGRGIEGETEAENVIGVAETIEAGTVTETIGNTGMTEEVVLTEEETTKEEGVAQGLPEEQLPPESTGVVGHLLEETTKENVSLHL